MRPVFSRSYSRRDVIRKPERVKKVETERNPPGIQLTPEW
jgi:hypothetical protein